MTYFMGIDGGGTSVRAVIIGRDLQHYGYGVSGNANPNSIGREAAAQSIQSAIRAALLDANLTDEQIVGVGAGIAGTRIANEWVSAVIRESLPFTKLKVSTDYEIALVGAHGKKEGVILVAGTGSIAYGINAAGDSKRVGGWGWLMGDEGSGYWIGVETLRAIVRAYDERAAPTTLRDVVLATLGLEAVDQLIDWTYSHASPSDIARLTPLVLSHANDPVARRIIENAATELAHAAHTVIHALQMTADHIKFAGGLLAESNLLSDQLTTKLGLVAMPKSLYAPSVGAAILGIHAAESSEI